MSFTPDTLLTHVREKAAHSAAFVFPIVDDEGLLVGILAKSNLLKMPERQLILVDHNELSQAVKLLGRLAAPHAECGASHHGGLQRVR